MGYWEARAEYADGSEVCKYIPYIPGSIRQDNQEQIAAARDFDDLCNIIEEAADDTNITNETYCDVYALCVNKAREL